MLYINICMYVSYTKSGIERWYYRIRIKKTTNKSRRWVNVPLLKHYNNEIMLKPDIFK